jgi:hypothetical protein
MPPLRVAMASKAAFRPTLGGAAIGAASQAPGSQEMVMICNLVRVLSVAIAAALCGCGAEVATTAATAASLQATQASQALQQQRQLEDKLGAALKAGEDRAAAASR